ncbi:PKD domain-containing protein [Dactylosporangium sp. McL0621]|uniref:YVTN family beta-propeller repeat protein n=1 Tax=Dactylosporangium sp. McL0621 TaxID=3415678 RepID=UPI003CEAB38D
MHKRILSGLAATVAGAAVGLVAGASPAGAAEVRPFLYVSATAPGTVSIVDTASGKEVNTTKAGGGSGDVAFVPAWDAVLATDSVNNRVTAFDPRVGLEFLTLTVGAEPHGVAAAAGLGNFYVANFGDGTLSVITTGTNGIVNVAVGDAPHGVAVTPDERLVYVTTADAVVVVDTATNAVVKRIPVPRSYGVAITPDGSRVYVTNWTADTVSVLDTATNTVTATVAVGNRPYDVVVAPDGRHAYVSNWGTGTVSVLDTTTNTVTVGVAVAGGHPYGLDITPDGKRVYATGGATAGNVTPIDTATNTAAAPIVLGHGVTNLAVGLIDPAPTKVQLTTELENGWYGDTVKATALPALSTARVVSYSFDFGDGTVVTGAEATVHHTYASGGGKIITLTATDAAGATITVNRRVDIWHSVKALGLMAASNARYVSAEAAGAQPLVANRTAVGSWEQFHFLDVGGGDVALLSIVKGTTVSVDAAGRLTVDGGLIDSPQIRFQLVPGADGTFGLRSRATGKYVSGNNGTGPLTADRDVLGPWEQFYSTYNIATGLAITANANHKIVTAEAAGAKPLIANRGAVGPWEKFDLIDTGNGTVALYAQADGRFVTAEAGGNQSLIANRTAIGAWERFTLVRNSDGSASLLAGANSKYVTAEAGGNQPLIANRTAIGPWEEFAGLVPA